MTIKQKVTFENGKTVVHFMGTGQADYALCGHDLAGDSIHENGSYGESTDTEEKVNCKHCISIVMYCKNIKNNEMSAGFNLKSLYK